MVDKIILRPPFCTSNADDFTPPITDWLSGSWDITHSTLPMWKSKRNVTITYKCLEPVAGGTIQGTDRLDSVVSYQPITSDKIKTVHGIEKASGKDACAWDWRGKGWLVVASSHWEILGHGNQGRGEWLVTFFAKTLFTPAGIDIYSRSGNGLSGDTVRGIKEALSKSENPTVQHLASEIFDVKRD